MRNCAYTGGFLLSLLLAVVTAGAWLYNVPESVGERCRKSNNLPGICVSIRECPSLLALLNRPNPDLVVLHEAGCGFSGRVPLVCCPDNITPKPTTTSPYTDTVSASQDVSHHRNVNLLPTEICGPVADSRIIGGNETGVLEYPWMALIGYQIRGEVQFHCGGSLVNERYVLTAAHCVTSLPSHFILKSVRLGEHNLNEPVDCDADINMCFPPPQDFAIEEAIPHEQYSKRAMKNDIALIRMKGRVDFTRSLVRPICLPVGPVHQNRNLDQEIMIVAGWGITENDVSSVVQQKVNVPVVPLQNCSVIYEKSVQIGPSQLCAGGEKGRDSCMGDSGGPLFFLGLVGEEQKTVQYGIVSFGPRFCGTEGMPGVYTRVGYYMDWILNNMKP